MRLVTATSCLQHGLLAQRKYDYHCRKEACEAGMVLPSADRIGSLDVLVVLSNSAAGDVPLVRAADV